MKIILFVNYKETEGMSKFSECQVSNCIITGNEDFISRSGIHLFDAVVVNVESLKEDDVSFPIKATFKTILDM